MYDLLHSREQAVRRYQAAVKLDAGSALADTARKRLKEPYSGN